jgi:hypothetical protein
MAVGLAGVFALRRLDDTDTWWHLAAGRWILENGRVPTTDTLSFTVPDHSWTNLQWLFDVVLYGLYRLGGADLLVLTSAFCFMLSVALLAWNVRRALGPVASCLLLSWVVLIANARFVIRPEMATFVLLECGLLIVASAHQREGRGLWLLVPLMLLWVNLHALFVLGLIVIGAAMVSTAVAEFPLFPRRWRQASRLSKIARRRLLVAGTASMAVTLLNPYFLHGAFFPLELLSRITESGGAFQAIGEFRRPFSGYFPTLDLRAYQVFFVLGVGVVGLAGLLEAFPRRREREPPLFNLGGLATFAAFAYLSLLARRNMGVFVMGATPFLAQSLHIVAIRLGPSIASRWESRLATRLPDGVRRRGALAAVITTVAVPAALGWLAFSVANNWWYARSGQTHEFGVGVLEGRFPIRAAEFVREQGIRGPMYNDLSAGGYLTWANPTGERVYIDGRLEVFGTEFFSQHMRTLRNTQLWQQQVQRFGIQSVLLYHRWSNRHPLIRWLVRNHEWVLVYSDEVAVVFVRAQGHADTIRRARAAFAERRETTRARLVSPVSLRTWPVARYTALESYARLMESLGQARDALALYEDMLKLKLPRGREVFARTRAALHLATRGDHGAALEHLERARVLDPENGTVRKMIARLGGSER